RLSQQLVHLCSRSWKNSASQNDALTVAQMWCQAREEAPNRIKGRVQVFVDRRADYNDDVLRFCDGIRRGRCAKRFSDVLAKKGIGTFLTEGHDALAHRLDRLRVDVVDRHAQSALRKCDCQRQADVAAAADDTDVELIA